MKINLIQQAFFCLLLPLQSYAVREIGSASELKEVISTKDPLVIMFYAPWCSACKSMKEPFHQVAERFAGQAKFVKVNADSEKLKECVDLFSIEAIPTIIIKHVGVVSKDQLTQSLHSLLPKPAVVNKKSTENKKTPEKKSSKKPQKSPAHGTKKTASVKKPQK